MIIKHIKIILENLKYILKIIFGDLKQLCYAMLIYLIKNPFPF